MTDTNALANAACAYARNGALPRIAQLAATAFAPLAVGTHVPGELLRVLPARAEKQGLAVEAVWESYREVLRPYLVQVDLEVRDHLRPDILNTANDRVKVNRRAIGDPDDLPTAALAAFLSPATVLSQDRLFFDFELAHSFDVRATANHLLEIARFDAAADAAMVVGQLALVTTRPGFSSVAQLGRRSPAIAVGVLLGAAVVAARAYPKFREGRLHKELTERALPLVEAAAGAFDAQRARVGEEVIATDPTWHEPSPESVIARLLFRAAEPMTSTAIFHGLRDAGWSMSRKEIYRAMVVHPAFVQVDRYAFRVGRPLS